MQYLSFIKAESLELNLKCLSAFFEENFQENYPWNQNFYFLVIFS